MKKLFLSLFVLAFSFQLLALNPVKEYSVLPSEFGMAYDEVTFKTDDGLELYGWYFKPTKTSGRAIIISHDGDGNMSDLIELVSSFLSVGYNVLTYDYRGYGKSADFKINSQFYMYAQFQKDLEAAIDYIRTRKSGITVVDLYGQGMGAGLVLAVPADNRRIKNVIADSPYSTLNDIQTTIEQVKGEKVLIPLGYDKNKLEPKYALENNIAKTKNYLFIVGDEDQIYTEKSVKELQKIVKKTATMYVVKGATSSTTFSTDKAKYFETIKEFIK